MIEFIDKKRGFGRRPLDLSFFKLALKLKVLSMSNQNAIDDLKEIRSMMEKSSRFISLSGLSGVMTGIYAFAGAWLGVKRSENMQLMDGNIWPEFSRHPFFYKDFFLIALGVLVLSVATGILLTARRANSKGQHLLDRTAKRMIYNLALPLIPGGFLAFAMLWAGFFEMVPAVLLIFYGLGLVNGSKYTLSDIRILGLLDILLGLIAAFQFEWRYTLWLTGFGLLHIVYGIYMYIRYERS